MFLHLKKLRCFTLVQDTSPEIAPGELVFQPVVASNSLEYLHFDIAVPGTAHENLASSVRANGFPRLRTIRASSVYHGLLQELCKPRAQIEQASDWVDKKSPLKISNGGLREARRAAQQRIEKARNTVQFEVLIEEEGVMHESFDLNGYVGTIGSNITYSLEPDIPRSDDALLDFPDIVSGKDEAEKREPCKGLWNASHSGGCKWWQHAERMIYRPLYLQNFF